MTKDQIRIDQVLNFLKVFYLSQFSDCLIILQFAFFLFCSATANLEDAFWYFTFLFIYLLNVLYVVYVIKLIDQRKKTQFPFKFNETRNQLMTFSGLIIISCFVISAKWTDNLLLFWLNYLTCFASIILFFSYHLLNNDTRNKFFCRDPGDLLPLESSLILSGTTGIILRHFQFFSEAQWLNDRYLFVSISLYLISLFTMVFFSIKVSHRA